MVDIITRYFTLTDKQKQQFEALGPVYEEWNAKINVISRKDMDQFYERHVLHSLAIAKVQKFSKGQQIMDIGTGGGFPGVPLAILFPEAEFTLADSIQKKLTVVNVAVEALELTNIKTFWGRVEALPGTYDYAVTRAVAPAETLLNWLNIPIKPKGKQKNLRIKNSLLCLKGGDLTEELAHINWPMEEYSIAKLFAGEFFETKKVIEIKFT